VSPPATEKASGKFEAEHRHRADRDVAPAQVRPGQRLPLVLRRIDRRPDPRAGADEIREQPQLPDRAGALALQPRPRQAGLGHRPLDERRAEIGDALGHSFETASACFWWRLREMRERRLRQRAGGLHLPRACGREGRLQGRSGGGIHGPEERGCGHVGGADQDAAADHHGPW
jgi:hypothetical protein